MARAVMDQDRTLCLAVSENGTMPMIKPTHADVQTVTLTTDGTGTQDTDITGPDRLKRPRRSNHCMSREGEPVRRFFALHETQDSDVVDITWTGSHAYAVSFRSRARVA